jgi:hypothetical protein
LDKYATLPRYYGLVARSTQTQKLCLDDTSSQWLNRTSGWWTKNKTQNILKFTIKENTFASAKKDLFDALKLLGTVHLKILALIKTATSKIMDFPSLYFANFFKFLATPSPIQLRLYQKGKSWYIKLPPYLIPLFRIPALSTGFSLVQQSAGGLDSYLVRFPSVRMRLHQGLLSLLRILRVSIQRLLVVFSFQIGERNVLNVLFYVKKVVNAKLGKVRDFAQTHLYPFQRLLVVVTFGLLFCWIPNLALQCVTIILYCVILILALFMIYWVFEIWLKIICRFLALTLRSTNFVIYQAFKIILYTYFYLELKIVCAYRFALRFLYILCIIIALHIKRTNVYDFILVTLGTIFLFLKLLYFDLEFYILRLLNFYALARMKINNCFLSSSFSLINIPEDKKITIFVKNLKNQTKAFMVSPTILVSDFLFLIKTKENYSQELSLALIFGCKTFHPNHTLIDLDVQDGSTLSLALRLKGGGPKKKIISSTQTTPKTHTGTKKVGTILGSPIPIKGTLQAELIPSDQGSPSFSPSSHEPPKKLTTDIEEILEQQAVEVDTLKEKISSMETILSQILEHVSTRNTIQSSSHSQSPITIDKDDQRKMDEEKITKHTMFSPYHPLTKKKLSFDSDSSNDEPSKSVSSPLSKQEEKLEPLTHYFDIDKEIHFLLGNEKQQKKFKKKSVDTSCKLEVDIYELKVPFQEWWDIFRFQIQSSGLIGHTEQIEWLFQQKMSPSIRSFFQQLHTGEKLRLKDMIIIVLSNYNKAPKDYLDYEEELNEISKSPSETVGSYYLRLTNLAEKAKVTNDRKLRKIYVRGLVPQALFTEVNKDVNANTTLEEAHALATIAESKYFEIKQYQQRHKKNVDPETSKPKKEDSPTNQKKATFKKSKKNINSNKNKNSGNSPKEWGECYYCGKKHDWKECQALNPYYKPHELELLKLVGKSPQKRDKWPDQPLSKNTPWIKELLEKKDKPISKVTNKSPEEETNTKK